MAKASSRAEKRGCSRKLIVVFDREADTEVKSRQNSRRVPLRLTGSKLSLPRCLRMSFHPVRRNKKIHKIIRMDKSETQQYIEIKIVTSVRESLSKIACIYARDVIEVLQRPEAFVYKRANEIKGVKVWHVLTADSGEVIMQIDFDKHQLNAIKVELERDIGVVTQSVRQLLSQRTYDVMAVNTYPGHHAGPARVAGFCSINNLVVAVALIKQRRPRCRVGVLDIDVHPGDGTQQFVERHRGLVSKYVSIHSSAEFWNCFDLGANGVALKLNKTRKVAAQRLIHTIQEVLTTWNRSRLDIVIVALGFDTLKRDPTVKQLGFQMLPAHFHDVGHVLAERREQILFVQEGGYNLNETANAFEYLIKGFREGRMARTV